jgi:hypothetical protein
VVAVRVRDDHLRAAPEVLAALSKGSGGGAVKKSPRRHSDAVGISTRPLSGGA